MNQKIDVNITPNSLAMPTLYFSQGDIGRVYLIEVVSSDGYDIPSGATVKIEATKPSGFGFSVTGTVTDNTVEIVSTAEMTDEAGRFFAKLEISSGGVVLGTANFCMSGQPDTHPEGTIDGSQETIIPQLTVMVERVENAAAAVLDTTTVATTLPAGSQATYSFDESTNTATFGIPQGEAGAGAAGVVASAYSASKTYAVGDYAIHNSNLYRCTTAITTAESFTASHWTQVVLADDVTDLKSDLNKTLISITRQPDATLDRIYINNSGVIGYDSGNLGRYIKCRPNTIYVLSRTNVNGFFGIGYINTAETDLASGTQTVDFRKSNSESTLTIKTSNDATYLFYYFVEGEASNVLLSLYLPRAAIDYCFAKLERGGLSAGKTSYSQLDHKKKLRGAYTYKTNGATSIAFANLNSIDYTHITVYLYDENMAYVSYIDLVQGLSCDLPSTCKYIRFMIGNEGDSIVFKDSIDILFYDADYPPEAVKNAKMRTGTEWLTMDVTDDVFTFARMLLPPNYSAEGVSSPLILYMDGSGNTTTWESDFSHEKLPYLEYLRDEGFAVLLVFGWGSYFYNKYSHCGRAYPYPTPTNLACMKAGVEWVCDRYNIDRDNIHIMSKSQGGQSALYYATVQSFPIKSIGMFAPILDYLSMPGEAYYADTRAAIVEDLNLQGDSSYFISGDYDTYTDEAVAYFRSNIEAICGLNEAWTGLVGNTLETNFENAIEDGNKFWDEQYWTTPVKTDIYDDTNISKIANVPVKIWGASDDNNTPYLKMVEVVKQLQNGGTEAVMRTFPRGTGGHSCADMGTNVIASVTTALGITYTDLPTGWYENVEWIRQHMTK